MPGATVRLDGKEVGQVQSDGTFTHETSAGLHAIELVKTGYATLRTQQAFAIGKRVGIEGKMFSDPEAAEEADYQAIASSTDPAVLRQHLQQYPNSKNTTAILNKIEEIDWKTVNRTDLASLDAFLRNRAQGQHASEAQQLVAELQTEQADYIAAEKTGTSASLQAFLDHHPKSPFAEQIRQKLSQQVAKDAVRSVLRRYEDSYNRKDLDGIVALWPSCPEHFKKAYRDSFHSPESQKLTLELGEPEIQGNFASIKGKETRSGALSASGPFTATLVRQGDKWVIQSGIF